MLDTNYLV